MSKPANDFGRDLKTLRDKTKMTLRDAEKKTGFGFTWLCKIENGREIPSWEALKTILKWYGEPESNLGSWAFRRLKATREQEFDLAIAFARTIDM